jgi:murein L,D-transpeptidase YafK
MASRVSTFRKHLCCTAAVLALLVLGQAPAAAAQGKELAPIPAQTLALMTARNTTPAAPILMRIYKKEAELEVWKRAQSGRYVLLKTFPICRWSGQLGPKQKQGDRQAPEGFYSVTPKQMNPNSSYYLSFDLGFPNEYDRAHGGSGAFLMVHGACTSAGCYAMTDDGVREIYAIAREAFAGGQKAFQVQAYPFRMTAENMAKYRTDPNIAFWRQLKDGADRFEATGQEPPVSVSAGRYVFGPFKDPKVEGLASTRVAEQKERVAALVEQGSAAIRTTYEDGGQHPSFAALSQRGISLGQLSRPEALAEAGRDIVVIRAKRPVTETASILPPRRPSQVAVHIEPALLVTASMSPGPAPLAAWPTISGAAEILPGSLIFRTRDLASRS